MTQTEPKEFAGAAASSPSDEVFRLLQPVREILGGMESFAVGSPIGYGDDEFRLVRLLFSTLSVFADYLPAEDLARLVPQLQGIIAKFEAEGGTLP